MSHLNGGRMTTGRPLPRPLPPIRDSSDPSYNGKSEETFRGHNSNFKLSSPHINNNFGNGSVGGSGMQEQRMFATSPRNFKLQEQRYDI